MPLILSGNGVVDGVSTTDMQQMQQRFVGGAFVPAGSLTAYCGQTAPTGWLLCHGQEISRTQYSDLFAALGTTYGSGDGSTTFNLPDLRGRVIAAPDNMGGTAAGRLNWSTTRGTSGGSQTHTIGESELPAHNHKLYDSAQGSGGTYGPTMGSALSQTTVSTANSHHGWWTSIQGGTVGQPHNNMQPTILLNYIIKV